MFPLDQLWGTFGSSNSTSDEWTQIGRPRELEFFVSIDSVE